jgi:hypothetical protein
MNLKHLSHHFLFDSPFGINGQKDYSYHLHVTPPLHFITSYFIHITCISSLLISLPLWHQWTKRLLIIIVLSGIGNIWVLFALNQFPSFPIDPREFHPCPTYVSMILDLLTMIKKYDNTERYIWHRYRLETIEPLKIEWATRIWNFGYC